MRRSAPWLFLAAFLAALSIHAWLWFNTDGTLKNTTWQPPAPLPSRFLEAALPVAPFPQLEPSQYLQVNEHPLFSKTRHPPPPPPPLPAPVAPDIFSTALLKGVYVLEQESGVIMQVNGKSRRLKINESIDGWTLKFVQGGAATFESNGSQRVVTMRRAPSAKTPN